MAAGLDMWRRGRQSSRCSLTKAAGEGLVSESKGRMDLFDETVVLRATESAVLRIAPVAGDGGAVRGRAR